MSIEEVMSRYFEDAEQNYPSVVANVVRTTGKLRRPEANRGCGLCGMALDELGNTKWKGEILDDRPRGACEQPMHKGKLCYGCERSIYG